MKNLISLMLALALCLTAVSAFAAESPNAMKNLLKGVTAEGATVVTDEATLAQAITFANSQLNAMAAILSEKTGNKAYYTENAAVQFKASESAEAGKKQNPLKNAVKVENLAIVPMPLAQVILNEKHEVRITLKDAPAAVKGLELNENEEITALFTYEKYGLTFFCVIEFAEVKDAAGNAAYVLVIPRDIALDASNCIATVNFEKVTWNAGDGFLENDGGWDWKPAFVPRFFL